MLAKCASCSSRILAGGETFLHWRFCDETCATRFRADLVDQIVPKEVVDQQIQAAFEAPCPLCQHPATNDLYSATKISAFLVFFQISSQKHVCCSSCGRKKRLAAALHCLVAGWWGPKAALCNLFVLPTNLIAAGFIRSPSSPSHALVTMVKSALAESMAPQIMAALQEAPAPSNQAAPNLDQTQRS